MKSVFSLIFILIYFGSIPLIGNSLFQEPQEKVKSLIIKANEFDNPATSLVYLNEAYQYIYDLEDDIEADLYLNLGIVHSVLSHSDSASYFLNQALNLAAKNLDKQLEVNVLKNLGDVAMAENEYKQATKYYLLALEKEEEIISSKHENFNSFFAINNHVATAIIFTALGIIFILIYENLHLKRKIKQKETKLEDALKKQATQSEVMASGNFSLPIKIINQQLNHPLSQREYEVLCLMVINNTNTQIAEQLFVSVNTVKTHLKNIFEKLDVINRKESIEKIISIKNS